MRLHWLNRGRSSALVIFVSGWATDHRLVAPSMPSDTDSVIIYDFREMSDADSLRSEICDAGYERKYLMAWSFGVWAAERIFGGEIFARAVAFNGTPRPVDDRFGIEPRRLEVTIRGLEKRGMEPFWRSVFGDYYQNYMELLNARPLLENIAELVKLRDVSLEAMTPTIAWNKAVVGEKDRIFPPDNMKAYWKERAEVLPLLHFPFAEGNLIAREIEGK